MDFLKIALLCGTAFGISVGLGAGAAAGIVLDFAREPLVGLGISLGSGVLSGVAMTWLMISHRRRCFGSQPDRSDEPISTEKANAGTLRRTGNENG